MKLAIFAAAAALLVGAPGAALSQAKPTTHGEWVHIRKGADSIRAYVAYSERSSPSPAIIVIHEIYGLTDWEPTVADRLAKQGYIAVVPDLLSSKHGRTPKDENEARK